VRVLSAGESISDGGSFAQTCKDCYLDKGSAFSLKALEGSASVKDGTLCVTACNTHPTEPAEMELEIRGGKVREAKVVTLAGKDFLALNTFERANAVKLSKAVTVEAKGKLLRIVMPPGSVVRAMGKVE
jgi:alpha-N-arabinofuranosidase